MGQPKPLLPWQGQTLIEFEVEQLLKAGAERVIVVLGHEKDRVAPLVQGKPGVDVVLNPDYRSGRASSVRAGAKLVPLEADSLLILNVDQPRPIHIMKRLLEEHKAAGALITVPRYRGRRGHPAIFSARLLPELTAVSEEGQGLREVMACHAGAVHEVEVDSEIVLLDLNTPEEYERAKQQWAEVGGAEA